MSVIKKAKVNAYVNPDILLMQEIEDRASLDEFNAKLLPEMRANPLKNSLLLKEATNGEIAKRRLSHQIH